MNWRLNVGDWHEVDPDGLSDGPWAAWRIYVCLGRMPDLTVAPTGLRIEPREDYDGSSRDQRVTLERLRQFPLGWATVRARIDSLGEEPTSQVHGQIDQILEATLRETRVAQAQIENRPAAMKRAGELEVQQMYRDAGWEERDIRLHRAAFHYEQAQRNPHVASPRRYVAEELDVSLTTVDRLLRDARKQGYLPPFDGGQGKHGKPALEQRLTTRDSGSNDPAMPRQRRSRSSAGEVSAAPVKVGKVKRPAKAIDRRERRGK